MTKSELIAALSENPYLNKKTAGPVLAHLFHIIKSELLNGGTVTLSGIGKLKAEDKPERRGRNPRTGETITIPARRSALFVPATKLKAAMRGEG